MKVQLRPMFDIVYRTRRDGFISFRALSRRDSGGMVYNPGQWVGPPSYHPYLFVFDTEENASKLLNLLRDPQTEIWRVKTSTCRKVNFLDDSETNQISLKWFWAHNPQLQIQYRETFGWPPTGVYRTHFVMLKEFIKTGDSALLNFLGR